MDDYHNREPKPSQWDLDFDAQLAAELKEHIWGKGLKARTSRGQTLVISLKRR